MLFWLMHDDWCTDAEICSVPLQPKIALMFQTWLFYSEICISEFLFLGGLLFCCAKKCQVSARRKLVLHNISLLFHSLQNRFRWLLLDTFELRSTFTDHIVPTVRHVVNRKKGLLQFITPAVTVWRHQTLLKLKTWHWVSRYVMFKKKERKTAKNHNDRWDDVHVHPFELVTDHKLSSSYVFICIPYSHPLFGLFSTLPPKSKGENRHKQFNNNN